MSQTDLNTPFTKAWFDYAFSIAKPEVVPPALRAVSEQICRELGIIGISDPLYIANSIAMDLGLGNGRSVFFKDAEISREANLEKLVPFLAFAYSTNVGGKEPLLRQLLTDYLQASRSQPLARPSAAPTPGQIKDNKMTTANSSEVFTRDADTGMDDAVAEMLRRLPECWGNGEPFDLGTKAIIEYYPSPGRFSSNGGGRVFAYQFLRATPEGEPLKNIATFIPDVSRRNADNLTIQTPGGRPYEVKVQGYAEFRRQVYATLLEQYADSPLLDLDPPPAAEESPESVLKDARLLVLMDMVKEHGVYQTMQLLARPKPQDEESQSTSQPESPH